MCDLSNPIFHDETKAREWLEARIWAHGRFCPHCGAVDQSTLMHGKSHRPGLYQCNVCREPFTVTVGTLYERSHVPLHKWLAATHLMMASKKGISAMQVHRMLGISYKTAWFLCHRIRESLRDTKLDTPLGGQNKVVEADETYIGGKEANKHKAKRRTDGARGPVGKEPVVALVERDGRVRSQHMPEVTSANLKLALHAQVDRRSYIMTDEAGAYRFVARDFGGHGTVNHSIEEYVRGSFWHTNTVEGYFSILKRGIVGTYHHVSQQHLKRYLAEFDYRYNERVALGVSDGERMAKSVAGIVGKRLTYRRPHRQSDLYARETLGADADAISILRGHGSRPIRKGEAMKSLRDAQSAARSLGHAVGGEAGKHAAVIADAFDALNDRLNALEGIVRALARQAGGKIGAADVLQATARAPSHFEDEVRRILGG